MSVLTARLHMISALAVPCLLLAACKKEEKPAPPPPAEVTVVTLQAGPVRLSTDLPGRISAFRIADVRPQVSGLILKRTFIEGDVVKGGQQLYQIDPAPFRATLASAQAAVLKAQAGVIAARATVERYKPLAKVFAISRQDYDNAVATLKQDEADVASGKASVLTARINLGYTSVRAPITGKTGRSAITEGALVTSDQTTSLVTITQLDPIYVDVTQPSTTLLRLEQELATGTLKSASGKGGASVDLLLEDGTRYTHPGKLQFSEATVDEGTGSVTIRAQFPNPDGLLLPGMFVQERVEEGIRQSAILIPQQAVTHNQHGDPIGLFVDEQGKVEQRVLTTDRAIGDKWLITAGAKAGDKVIVEGIQKAKPGAQVKIVEASPPNSQPGGSVPPPAAPPAPATNQ